MNNAGYHPPDVTERSLEIAAEPERGHLTDAQRRSLDHSVNAMTDKQAEVLSLIIGRVRRGDKPPTVRELAVRTEMSVTATQHKIVCLIKRGHLRRNGGKIYLSTTTAVRLGLKQ